MATLQLGKGETQSVVAAVALDNIAVGALLTNVLQVVQSGLPMIGTFTMSFDTAPSAVAVDIEFSEGGPTGIFTKLFQMTRVAGESHSVQILPGYYRGRLISKTGTTQLLTVALALVDEIDESTPNGAEVRILSKSAELTLATGGANTDLANFLPANSELLGLVTRVTEAINIATGFSVADAVTAARFSANAAGLTIGSTRVCLDHRQPTAASAAAGPVQPAAGTLRITTAGGQNTLGKVRVTLFYREYTPPAS